MLLDFKRADGTKISFAERTQPARRLWWILPDDLLPAQYAPVRSNVPMTCQYRPQKTIPFTDKLQNFIFNLNRSDNEARDRSVFQAYRDTWNTVGKVRDHYNAITGEGDPNDLPTLELNIGMAGNVVSGIPMTSDGSMGIPSGTPVLQIETLNPDNLPTSISYVGNEHLIHHQTIIIGTMYGGQRKRNPFIQMGGRAIEPYLPCLTALISTVPLYIEMYKLKEVLDIPNPYNPEWV